KRLLGWVKGISVHDCTPPHLPLSIRPDRGRPLEVARQPRDHSRCVGRGQSLIVARGPEGHALGDRTGREAGAGFGQRSVGATFFSCLGGGVARRVAWGDRDSAGSSVLVVAALG